MTNFVATSIVWGGFWKYWIRYVPYNDKCFIPSKKYQNIKHYPLHFNLSYSIKFRVTFKGRNEVLKSY